MAQTVRPPCPEGRSCLSNVARRGRRRQVLGGWQGKGREGKRREKGRPGWRCAARVDAVGFVREAIVRALPGRQASVRNGSMAQGNRETFR